MQFFMWDVKVFIKLCIFFYVTLFPAKSWKINVIQVNLIL